MLKIIALITVLYLFACSRLIHGGNKFIGSWYFKKKPNAEKLPGCKIIAPIVATIAFATWLLSIDEFSWFILPLFGIFWWLTFAPGIQPYYSIGASTAPRRKAVAFIDSILNKIFGQWPEQTPSVLYRVTRDSLGFFLRMGVLSIPLFTTVGLFIDFSFDAVIYGLLSSVLFGAGSVIIYGLYNWFYPVKYRTDSSLNPSEIFVGLLLVVLIMF